MRRTRRSLLTTLATGACGGLAGAGANAATAAPPAWPPVPDGEVVRTRIEVAADGSARWTVTGQGALDAGDEDAFRASAHDVVARAQAGTGREMHAEGFDARTVDDDGSLVAYGFDWTGFARRRGDRLVAGDAFVGGYRLDQGSSLVVCPPDGYVVESAAPAPVARGERTVAWTGPRAFGDQRPRVVVAPRTAGGAAGTAANDGERGFRGTVWQYPAAFVGLVGTGLAGYLAGRQKRGER